MRNDLTKENGTEGRGRGAKRGRVKMGEHEESTLNRGSQEEEQPEFLVTS